MRDAKIDINESIIKKYVESKRPEDPDIRAKLDFGYSYDGRYVILFEIRPDWNNPKEFQHREFAKIRYYKSREEWNLYWMRGSGKWEIYGPFPESNQLKRILKIINEDKYGCFYG